MKTMTIFMIIFVLGSYSVASSQTEVTLNAVMDNTLYEHNSGSLSNGAGDYLFVGNSNSGIIHRALLSFNITANIPANANIESVVLTLYMSRSQAGDEPIELHKVSADWGEGTSNASGNEGSGAASTTGDATWIHRFFDTELWNTAGGDFHSTVSASQTVGGIGSYTWSSTAQMVADVQDWLDNETSNFGWILIGNEESNQTAKRFNSRQSSNESQQPKLTIQYTPAVAISTPETGNTPDDFTLYQNYPNPFNRSTLIQFKLPQTGKVSLVIFDLAGNEVIRLLNQQIPTGLNKIV